MESALPAAAYPIETSADEFTRLTIQADLFREDARAMLARLGNGAGLNVLDMCCGIGGTIDVLSEWVGTSGSVTGADLDTAKLEHARTLAAEKGYDNVTFMEDNAFASKLEPASFDLVHTRFSISVIESGLGILDELLRLVKPGGIVFLEEANTNTAACTPDTEDWREAFRISWETFRVIGADTTIGTRLEGECAARGMTDITVTPCRHELDANTPMHFHIPLTLAAMRETIAEEGLMGKEELDALVARVMAHLAKPDTRTTTFTMMQIAGRVPG